jgi:hypothetical protein
MRYHTRQLVTMSLTLFDHKTTFRSILMCQGATPPEVINKRSGKRPFIAPFGFAALSMAA